MKRRGCIYSEWTNPGDRHCRGGAGLTVIGARSRKFRWVAEISYYGVRHRFRTTVYSNAVAWLNDMIERFN